MVQLGNATMAQLGGEVTVPQYNRAAVTPGIVHFGVGGFHRAHQAWYLDQLMNQGDGLDYGIIGVGLMPADLRMAQLLSQQDCLYTLVTKDPNGRSTACVIGSIMECLYGPDDPAAVVQRLTDPRIRIVSLTITEGGYYTDQITGEFAADNPIIEAEVGSGGPPSTVFGYLYEALVARRNNGCPPFTLMCCDNIPHGGEVLQKALVSYASLRSEADARWIDQHVRFPSSMVDRITPATTTADKASVSQLYGITDGWPVVAEEFTQWALVDSFPLGRPPWEQAGVIMTDDVTPYEMMKLRLLNASHQGIAYFAYLAGFRYVHEAARDADISQFISDYMALEAAPTLQSLAGVDLTTYQRTLIERFRNDQIQDTIDRLAADTSDRIPKFLVPVIRDQLAKNGDIRRSAAIVASWARYAIGVDEHGKPIDVVDNAKARIMAAAKGWETDPLCFLRQPEFFGGFVEQPRFTEAYLWAWNSLQRDGARATLDSLVHMA